MDVPDGDLLEAAAVQQRLFPHRAPDVPGYTVAGRCVPARQIGGDFFDWYSLGERFQVVLGDVMGKGITAAMIASGVRVLLRGGARFTDLAENVLHTGWGMQPDLAESGAFVTLFCARLEPATGQVEYVDAGHGLNMVLPAEGGFRPLRTPGLPLGAVHDDTWTTATTCLAPGDTLLSVSDGVLDCFPSLRLAIGAAVQANLDSVDAGELVGRIIDFARGQAAEDDVTALAVRRSRLTGQPMRSGPAEEGIR